MALTRDESVKMVATMDLSLTQMTSCQLMTGLGRRKRPTSDDPCGQFDISFNPAAPNTTVEDGGRWDSYGPSRSPTALTVFRRP